MHRGLYKHNRRGEVSTRNFSATSGYSVSKLKGTVGYLDDIIGSCRTGAEYDSNLGPVLKHFRDYGIRIRTEK